MINQILKRANLMAALCGAGLLAVTTLPAQTIVSGSLTGTHHWYRTNSYQLNGMVFVRSGGVLHIEAGTVIKGHNLGTFSTNVSALVVCRGGKIFAEGTPQNPIIFTAENDDTTLPDDLDIYQRGLWGGVVILGRTTINGALDVAGNAANPKYEVYEGLPDVVIGGENVLRYGGTDDNDNSGVMRYVSIRHGGALLATDKEINGLSLGAVGRGTTIEFVETYAFADDGFEFFGGTVNTKYLVAAFCDDDSFDTDMGFRGTNQFWFAIQPPDKRNYGMELNNQINEIATGSLLTPQADFKVYNMTVIGSGTGNTSVNGGRNAAIILRPYAAPKIFNSIFTDFNERAIELETRNGINSSTSVTNGYAQFQNNLWWGFVRGSGSGVVDNSITNLSRFTVASNYWTDTSLSNLIVDPMLGNISRTNVGATLDPRPRTGSPALNAANVGATPNNGFLTPVNYIGAFGPNDLWIANWTALSEYGVVTPAATATTIVSGSLSGTHHWYRTNSYQLNGMVFVRSGGVLHIEAGTVIKGHNLGTFSTNVSALVVCRGGKIFAEGTPQNPIIFTAENDDTTLPDDLDIYQRGLWGGVVILGRTTINGALDVAGNAANPKYEVYEGLPDVVIGGENVLRYGGTDDNDNSGVMRYVSIRHGGALLATDKEINGLSLGAVGRGTTIEFVETYAFADDGFEFFGGTVNTKYLVAAFCDDDSFDTDMGFRGTNQFWFAIQPPDKRNYGMELNNQINEIATGSLLTPQADFKVYNMTVIGSGTGNTSVNGGRNAAIILRPYAAPKIFNSIFTDFNERAIELETRNGINSSTSVTNGYAQFQNNLWWGFVRGSGSGVVDNSITNLSRFTVASNYWTDTSLSNLIVDPMLGNISRTNVGATLDPRPRTGSPALNAANVGASPGNVTAANYIGAFGTVNWASDWTALGEYSVLTGAGAGTPSSSTWAPGQPAPPNIASGPTSQTNLVGTPVSFSVTATGDEPLSYQWYFNNAIIGGATGSSYDIASVSAGNAGPYFVIVTNIAGSATSSVATLTVISPQPPVITQQPASLAVCERFPATFSVTATGDAPLSYQWRFNSNDLSGATSSTYTIASASTNNAGSYDVVVSNPNGSVTSVVAVLTVETTFAGFVNKGLIGVGRLDANSFDSLGAGVDTLGGVFSAMVFDQASLVRTGNETTGYTYSGTLYGLPDRGFGDGAQDYHPRVQTLSLSLTPYYGSAPTSQTQVAFAPVATTLFTYDGTNFTGFDPDALSVTNFPQSSSNSLGQGKRSLDAEGLVRTADGGFFVADEYGPMITRFNASGQLQYTLFPPEGLLPRRGAYPGVPAFTGTNNPTSGRRSNRGFEGLTLMPDGKRLATVLQSPAMQDGGANNPSRNTRLLIFDIDPVSATFGRAIAEYVYHLTLNAATATNRHTPLSELLAINNEQFLVLERDGIGLGALPPAQPIYKKVNVLSIRGATNIINSGYDLEFGAPGSTALPQGALPSNIGAAQRFDFVDIIDTNQLVKFGLNINTNQDQNTIGEKWEGLALIPLNDVEFPNDYLLLVGNDNDFKATNVIHNGVIVGTNTVPLDNMLLAYRVSIGTGCGTTNGQPNVPPTIAITGPTNATLSAPATIVLTGTPYDQDGLITNVVFYEGATLLGADSTFPFQFTIPGRGEGTYSFTAVAYDQMGASATSAVKTVVVTLANIAANVAITSPTNGANVRANANLPLTAVASDPDGTIASVEFYEGTTLLGSDASAPYSGVASNIAAGAHSYFAVAYDNQGTATTSAVVNVTAYIAPTITQQPVGSTNDIGSDVTFSVTATGDTPLSYQWRFNGAAISNATANTFTLTNLQTAQSGNYSVIVSNLGGSVTSVNAVLVVRGSPAQFNGMNKIPNGPFQFQISGSPGAVYDIQANSDLTTTNWITIAVITNTGGQTFYSDSTATNFNQRFYRAMPR